MSALPSPLVSVDWLAAQLGAADLRLVDGTYHVGGGRDARAEHAGLRLPGAVWFDIDAISARHDPRPHMLPPPETFAADVGALGLGSDCRIVVYDAHGLQTAARVWWMFRVFGHDAVAVLDGGLPAWRAAGLPTESGPPAPPAPAQFRPWFRPELVADANAIHYAIAKKEAAIVDARSAGRFAGAEPEPRPGLAAGHMPGARSLPFAALLAPETKLMLPPEDLAARFAAAGAPLGQPMIATCGSGVTACVLALAAKLHGHDIPVYDGSWSEWGADPASPIETGPAR